MRIAHIITRMILGGAQENTFLCCRDLLQIYQDEVLLITGPPLGPEGSLLEQVRSAGIPVEVIPSLRRSIHPWRDWRSYVAIRRALRKFDPQVVHTHSAKGGILGRLAASSLQVGAIVHTVHGAPFHPYQPTYARALFRACERYAASRCHALVSVADAMTELLVQAQVAPREKFTTIYSGIDVQPFLEAEQHRKATRQQLGYEPQHVVVGKVARLFHLKGHADVIRAARQVVDRHPYVRFLLIGDGLLHDSLMRQIEQGGLGEYFQLVGLVDPKRIPSLLSATDIVVHASLREGLARVLPQALIAGRPVVSYDVDGAREVVLPGQTGYLCAPQNVQALADSLIQLANDPQLRERLGCEGRRCFTESFRHETMSQRLRQLYQRLLRPEP